MDEQVVDLTTSLGPVTAEFSKSWLTGEVVATVCTRPGFAINRHGYAGALFLTGPAWTENSAHPIYDRTFADKDGRHPLPAERAAMVAAIRAALAHYAEHAAAA
jgi:hypothetical protein